MTDHPRENRRMDQWSLYPPPGQPSNPPTWEDIERLALHYPAAHHAVVKVQRGDWTREEAMILLVYALADAFQKLFQAEVDRLQNTVDTKIGVPFGPINPFERT
jgi:hypothetical protein